MTRDPDNQCSTSDEQSQSSAASSVAIIGMACRFPGAGDPGQFWRNLVGGTESISFFSTAALLQSGVPRETVEDPAFVPARGVIEDACGFDNAFFGISPREAELMDPQFRHFLELSYSALEDAGYGRTRKGRVGVFGGLGAPAYLLAVANKYATGSSSTLLSALISNDKDYVTTLASYKLGLSGPAISVQTACSTSLVAVHLAVQSLLCGESDMTVAGGVSVGCPQIRGYWHQPNGVMSSDGHCRAFDERADGLVEGNGAGFVVLKRLEDAIADGDNIHAVIRGTAVNNDGSDKVGYTAPGLSGQCEVIADALAVAGVAADSVGFIEAHGTGTRMGDSVEVEALARTYGAERKHPCILGSVKTNVGHLGAASGMAGLIKAVQAIKHGVVPPTLHFKSANPELALERGGFRVSSEVTSWPLSGVRRAAVSSFGIGGTNAHLVLEQAPERAPSAPPPAIETLWAWSAQSAQACDEMRVRLAERCAQEPDLKAADVAHTLWVGRRFMPYRGALVCGNLGEAIQALRTGEGLQPTLCPDPPPRIVFMFTGMGEQYAGMGRGMYDASPAFRDAFDQCEAEFRKHIECDLRAEVFGGSEARAAGFDARSFFGRGALSSSGSVSHPGLFSLQYALVQELKAWGVEPHAVMGHSLGDYLAAHLAGVLDFSAVVELIALREVALAQSGTGSMLAVPLSEEELTKRLGVGAWISAVNAPNMCTVSGQSSVIEALRLRLMSEGVASLTVASDHAFHCPLMESFSRQLSAMCARFSFRAPQMLWMSTVLGKALPTEQAVPSEYFAWHLERPVQFQRCVQQLAGPEGTVFVEVGAGLSLSSFVQLNGPGRVRTIQTLPHRSEQGTDRRTLLSALAKLWLAGAPVEPPPGVGHRQSLPTYPFEHSQFDLSDGLLRTTTRSDEPRTAQAKSAAGRWRLAWQAEALEPLGPGDTTLIIFDPALVPRQLATAWSDDDAILTAELGHAELVQLSPRRFGVNGTDQTNLTRLLDAVASSGRMATRVAIFPPIATAQQQVAAAGAASDSQLAANTQQVLSPVLGLALLCSRMAHPPRVTVITDTAIAVSGAEIVRPEQAALLAAVQVLSREFTSVGWRLVDLHCETSLALPMALGRLRDELVHGEGGLVVLRGSDRLVPALEPLAPSPSPSAPSRHLMVLGDRDRASRLAHALSRDGSVAVTLVHAGRDSTLQDSPPARGVLHCVQLEALEAQAIDSSVVMAERRFGPVTAFVWVTSRRPKRGIGQLLAEEPAGAFSPTLAAINESSALRRLPGCFVLPASLCSGEPGRIEEALESSLITSLAQHHNLSVRSRWYCAIATEAWLRDGGCPSDPGAGCTVLLGDEFPGFTADAWPKAEMAAGSTDVDVETSPESELETQIAGFWCELLGVPRVRALDNFFELGGQSLNGLQLLSRIRAAYGVQLTLRQLFQAATVRQQALLIEEVLLSEIEDMDEQSPSTEDPAPRSAKPETEWPAAVPGDELKEAE